MEQVKNILQEAIRQHVTGLKTQSSSILLCGAPGTGKTLLLQALAGDFSSSQYCRVSSYDLISKWLGNNKEQVEEVFVKARTYKPSVICLDDVEGFCGGEGEDARQAARLELLTQLKGVLEDDVGILVIGATAVPWELDQELKQRFEQCLYVPMLGEHARECVFKKQLGCVPNNLTDDDFTGLGLKSNGCTGADITCVCRDALLWPVRKLQKATHFKRVKGRRHNDAVEVDDLLTPCCPGDAGAIEMTWTDLREDDLAESILSLEDVTRSIEDMKPTVDQSYLDKIQKFTEDTAKDPNMLTM